MTTDEDIARTWDIVDQLADAAPVDIEETERGAEFKNYKGDTVYILPIAGSSD